MQELEMIDRSSRSSGQHRLTLKRKVSKWQRDPVALPNDDKTNFIFMDLYPILENGSLNKSYMEIMRQLQGKALVIIGLWLPFVEAEKIYHSITKRQLKEPTLSSSSPFYFTHPHFQPAHNCNFIFLMGNYQEKPSVDTLTKEENKLFWKYPQIIIAHENIYTFFQKIQAIPSLQRLLSFQQKFLFFKPHSLEVDSQIHQDRQTLKELNRECLYPFIFKSLKRNPTRALYETKKISIYLFNMLLHQYSNDRQYFEQAIHSFIKEDIEDPFDKQIQRIQHRLPLDQYELEKEIATVVERMLFLLQNNLPILRRSQMENEIISETKRNIDAVTEKLFKLNAQLGEQKNKTIIENAYNKLLKTLESDKIIPSYDSISNGFVAFIDQIDYSSVKIETLMGNFNIFMKDKKKDYFSSARKILKQNHNNFRQSMKQEEIQDKIHMKRAMLGALEKEVRQLEQKKAYIQKENQRLKKQGEKLHNQVRFSSKNSNGEGEDQLHSYKTFAQSSREPMKMKESVSVKRQPQFQKMEKKEKTCCCTIF